MIRILVVDDSALMRQVLRELFAGSPDMQVVGEASNEIGRASCRVSV